MTIEPPFDSQRAMAIWGVIIILIFLIGCIVIGLKNGWS